MKKTDNRELWQPAPINGKDVSWDFIIENLEQGDRKVAQHPTAMHATLYVNRGDDGYTWVHMVVLSRTLHHLSVYGPNEGAVKTLLHEISDPINEDNSTDLYANCSDIKYADKAREYIGHLHFYHTDPNH